MLHLSNLPQGLRLVLGRVDGLRIVDVGFVNRLRLRRLHEALTLDLELFLLFLSFSHRCIDINIGVNFKSKRLGRGIARKRGARAANPGQRGLVSLLLAI